MIQKANRCEMQGAVQEIAIWPTPKSRTRSWGVRCVSRTEVKSQKRWVICQLVAFANWTEVFVFLIILITTVIMIMCICWALTMCQERSEGSAEWTEHLWLWPHWSPSRNAGPIPCWLSSSRPYTCPREEAKCTSEGGGQRDNWPRAACCWNKVTQRLDGPSQIERQDRNWSLKSLGTDICPLPSFFWKPQ